MMRAKDQKSRLSMPHDAMIFVGDGQKALFLRNKGDEKFPNLIAERVFVDDNPLTHEQGTDRPGRVFKRAATNRRSGVAATDWHEIEKHRFARRVAAAMERASSCEEGPSDYHRRPTSYPGGSAPGISRRRKQQNRCRNWQGPDQASYRRY